MSLKSLHFLHNYIYSCIIGSKDKKSTEMCIPKTYAYLVTDFIEEINNKNCLQYLFNRFYIIFFLTYFFNSIMYLIK